MRLPDKGYPIRSYGPDLALAYDWLYTAPGVDAALLSESTEAYDRGDKVAHDQAIPSLRDVVFVATSGARLDHSTRQSDRT